MDRETIFESDFATLWYYPKSKIVHHQIKKYLFGDALRSLFTKGTELMVKNGAVKWLSDDRSNNATTAADAEWIESVWRPKTVQAGWKYWAIVMPDKITGKLNMKKHAAQLAEYGVTIEIFDDPELALKWLEAK